jgi:DNA-binding transcriptional LysR family regulator
MRKLPNFVLLRAFEAAARLESFTRAAEELHLTQSAISHQIRELEEHFGRQLFVRRNRRVELTPEGRRLLETLSRVFDAIELACKEVRLSPKAQVLALHCSPSFAVNWLGPRLPLFMKAYPDITIRMTSSSEPVDLSRVSELDVAISYGAPPRRAAVTVLPLGKERIAPLCAPALLKKDIAPAKRITQLPLIDSPLSQATWADWFRLNKLVMPELPRSSFDRAALVISAAVDQIGVALESTRLAERSLKRGELIELGKREFKAIEQETHFLGFRSSEASQPKIELFRDWLLLQVQ